MVERLNRNISKHTNLFVFVKRIKNDRNNPKNDEYMKNVAYPTFVLNYFDLLAKTKGHMTTA